jgi:diguanylate cyclase (GGDEF)-like protein
MLRTPGRRVCTVRPGAADLICPEGSIRQASGRKVVVTIEGLAHDRLRADPLTRFSFGGHANVALHRRAALVTVLVTALTAAVAGVGLLQLHLAHRQASALATRSVAAELLASAQSNIAQSRSQTETALFSTQDLALSTALPHALTQAQTGIAEWAEYKKAALLWGPLTAQAARLDQDVAALTAATVPAAPISGAPTSTEVPLAAAAQSQLQKMVVLYGQVDADFAAVRTVDQAWRTNALDRDRASMGRGIVWLLAIGCSALVITLSANGLLARTARRRDLDLSERDRELELVATANEFEARLQRALELSSTENRVYKVVEEALNEAVPEFSVEMLLADSSRAHFRRLASTGGEEASHICAVGSPSECPAVQRGEVFVFPSSLALDACPYLKEAPGPSSATCVPVSVSGVTIGVVHAAGVVDSPPSPQRRTALELVARRASDRIGMMRAFSRSETQASTDALTGLPNRRSLEESVRQLTVVGTPYAVAFGDLDHFKAVNDVHGHAAGDVALRIFSKVLRAGLRPGDLVARYGGEEFVVVLPNCHDTAAVKVLERISEQLAIALAEAGSPSFTVSFGLACSQPDQEFHDAIAGADGALLEAKSLGRNCIVVATRGGSAAPDSPAVAIGSRASTRTATAAS